MRLLVVFALTLCVQVLHAEFYTTSLSWDSVASQEVLIPENYTGTATLTLHPLEAEDVVVCVNWLVPAEAPEDVNLAETWNVTCQYALTVLAGTDPVVLSVALRTNINYVSAALINEDADSDGNSDETFDFSWELSYDSCPSGSSGPSCTSVVDVDYSLIITANAFTVFRLPTLFDKSGGQFLQYISFSLPTAGAGAEMDASNVLISYRLNGPVTTLSDGNCTSAKFATCIPNPPFYSASETYWEISVSDKLTFQIIPIFCSDGRIGADCKTSLIDFENEAGVPLTRTGPASFVFYGSDLSVAVGALDGYTQQSTAPSLVTQLDALPVVSSVLSSGINSKANRLSFSLANIGATDESRFVVTVQAGNKDSYAIWIVPNSTTNQCPENCSNHGNCIDFVCECEEDYNGIACEHEVKTFTIEYIILIAVGGLLVLSIVIGVPIYCWMNRQQDYETIE